MELFSRVIKTLAPVRQVHVQGEGEPLLHPEILSMLRIARKHAEVVTTITNGSLLEEASGHLIEIGIDRVGISLETADADEFHRIRGGSLSSVIAGVEAVLTHRSKAGGQRPAVGFEVIVMRNRFEAMAPIVELYNRLGMDGGISMQPLSTAPFYMEKYDEELKNEIIAVDKSYALAKLFLKVDRMVKVNPVVDAVLPLRQSVNKEPACPILSSGLFVSAAGKVSFCCLIKDGEDRFLGDLKNDSLADVLARRQRRLEAYRSTGEVPMECVGCAKR